MAPFDFLLKMKCSAHNGIQTSWRTCDEVFDVCAGVLEMRGWVMCSTHLGGGQAVCREDEKFVGNERERKRHLTSSHLCFPFSNLIWIVQALVIVRSLYQVNWTTGNEEVHVILHTVVTFWDSYACWSHMCNSLHPDSSLEPKSWSVWAFQTSGPLLTPVPPCVSPPST